jgi:hypothetical protein
VRKERVVLPKDASQAHAALEKIFKGTDAPLEETSDQTEPVGPSTPVPSDQAVEDPPLFREH